jgi:2-keto-4-pentenoate hydratase/2-oxohepta-3-ene-1,7-dioic acid hydratase in catechol pathway
LKIARFKHNNKQHVGIVNEKTGTVTVITKPATIEQLIRQNTKTLDAVEKGAVLKLDQVQLQAPIAHPTKIICLGLNYYDHAKEQNAQIPDEPIIFLKPHTAITGPNQPVLKPKFVKQLDYEAELAIIIGKKAKNIALTEAKHHIFGYTVLNDVSARDVQFKDKQWTRGKSFDTFAPTGPYVTTADQIGNPNNLRIRTWVNRELRQDSSTKNMVFNVYQVVHHLSRVMTLEPTDIIATGTPAGVGFAMKPEPKFLKSGDMVKVEIEGIGTLENHVIEA